MPLYPLRDIYHYLIRSSNSFMRYSLPWWSKTSQREVVEIPAEHRWGTAEWIIFNRRHAHVIAEDQEFIEIFAKHECDHESYPPSLLSLRGCLDEVVFRQTTYASFMNSSVVHRPYSFSSYHTLEARYIENAKKGGCLFARKFAPDFPSDALHAIADQRLMPAPALMLSDSELLTPALEQKINLLQAQEELSQANTCLLLSNLISDGAFEIGYEIGVGLGLHLQRLFESTLIERMTGIDDYKRKIYQGIAFNPNEEDCLYGYAQKQIQSLNLNAEIIRDSPLESADTIPDGGIDFIYFNSEHLSSSLEDLLAAWYPKVRKGGLIAGYQTMAFYPHLMPSIEDFFLEKNLKVNCEIPEPQFWWVSI